MTYRLAVELRKRTRAFAQTVKNIANMTKEKMEELREMLLKIEHLANEQFSLIEDAIEEIKKEIDPPDDF